MAKLLLNADGKVLTSNDKVLKAPEGVNPLQALVNGKGANAGYYLFYEYKGDNLDFISDIDFSANTTCYNMFGVCTNLQTIPLFDTSKVTSMNSMFYSNRKLQIIPLLDTSSATTINNMFESCVSLQTIPQLDTSSATTMRYMFYSCSKLQTIDITSMDLLTSTNNTDSFASNCYSLTKLIIRTMTVIPPLNSNAFNYCHHFTGNKHSTYNPDSLKDGRIYVPDDFVEQLKEATNWSAYADIIVPLSTLQEE